MSIVQPPLIAALLDEILRERILVLDGAMGTMVHALGFGEADYRGRQFADHPKDLKNFIDILSITQPEAIENIHRQYLEAGADIIETNTFNASAAELPEYGFDGSVARELNLAACQLARRAVDDFNLRTPDRPRFVAGSIGPTRKQLSIAGNVDDPGHRNATFDQMVASYYRAGRRAGRRGRRYPAWRRRRSTRWSSRPACLRSTSTSTITACACR